MRLQFIADVRIFHRYEPSNLKSRESFFIVLLAFNTFNLTISGIYLYPLHLSNLLQILGRYDGKLRRLSIRSYFAFAISVCSALAVHRHTIIVLSVLQNNLRGDQGPL
jgi:hypothetical protein